MLSGVEYGICFITSGPACIYVESSPDICCGPRTSMD